jgi:hypothetical protein
MAVVTIQNRLTGKQAKVNSFFFEQRKKAGDKSFADFEIVPEIGETTEAEPVKKTRKAKSETE